MPTEHPTNRQYTTIAHASQLKLFKLAPEEKASVEFPDGHNSMDSDVQKVIIKTQCNKTCDGKLVYAEENALCFLRFKSIYWTATIESGKCVNGECRETNESEIYKRELLEPLYDIRDRTQLIKWPFKCQFTNIQDKNDAVFLSTECSLYCDKRTVKLREDGTPCTFSIELRDVDSAIITPGVCDGGKCMDRNCTAVEVQKELVFNPYEESYGDYKKRGPK
ncbi:uncharacterized protein LOC115316344 [Ixodes scapularis]|uniref:uncharacterized protein LOC115316344 n=1 Tax=Ixodes scapularis TaxID=6945 RepID=UPI001A9E44E3|nr:uncharacterized protein LOC115316344 [Ixodes scapularis]